MPDPDIFNEEEENKNIKPEDKTIETGLEDDKVTTDQLLASIVNDDGEQKYGSIEEALKATAHAQTYIKKIEKENAEYEAKGSPSEKLDELLAVVKQSKDGGGEDNQSPTMKPEDVLGIVKDYFDDTKAAESRQGNINTVTTAFKDRFGKDASKELYGRANDLGFTQTEINSMVANNPSAALKILGVEGKVKKPTDTVITPNQVNTSQFREKPNQAPKSVMGSTKSGELMDAFKASQQRTLERLGITEN